MQRKTNWLLENAEIDLHFATKLSLFYLPSRTAIQPQLLSIVDHDSLGVCPQKTKDALSVLNAFSIQDLIAFKEKVNWKFFVSVPLRYRYGIIFFQQQRNVSCFAPRQAWWRAVFPSLSTVSRVVVSSSIKYSTTVAD